MRRFSLALVLAFLFVLVACGGSDSTSSVSEAPAVTSSDDTPVTSSLAGTPTTDSSPATQQSTTATLAATVPPETSTIPAPVKLFAVDDLAVDTSGGLWATTGDNRTVNYGVQYGTDRHLYRLVGDVWQLVEQPEVVFDDVINWEIQAASECGVYVASSPTMTDTGPSGNGGVYLTDGENWELFEEEFTCGSLAVDTTGVLWATCPDFLTRLVDGDWDDVPEGWTAQSVSTGSDGSVWFTTFTLPGFELLRFDGTGWTSVAPCEDCYGPRSILGIDPMGSAWVARGECGLDGTTRFDPSGGTEEFDILGVRDIAFGADDSVWLANPCVGLSPDAGVARYVDGEFRSYTTTDGLPSDAIQAVEVAPDGTVYVGSDFGVIRYESDSDSWVLVGGL